jgi:hypothetical protein
MTKFSAGSVMKPENYFFHTFGFGFYLLYCSYMACSGYGVDIVYD